MSVRLEFDIFGDTRASCVVAAEKDKVIAFALKEIGEPVVRRRPGGFEALFRIIVEQQVSVASANAIFGRCRDALASMTPAAVIDQGTDGLRACGLSGPKARYVMGIADAIEAGDFDTARLPALPDDEAMATLQSLKGVGPWTAAIYLMFCEGRRDIWPPRDVALLAAYRAARKAMKMRGPAPDMEKLDARAARFAPERGLAAHILWTYFGKIMGREPV